jgi:hypothetical protein
MECTIGQSFIQIRLSSKGDNIAAPPKQHTVLLDGSNISADVRAAAGKPSDDGYAALNIRCAVPSIETTCFG